MKTIVHKLLFSLPKLSFQLSGNDFYRAVWLYVRLVYISVLWKFANKMKKKFVFKFNKTQFALQLQDSTDIAALEEIYVKNEYLMELPFQPLTILDLGANYGDTALYYHIRYPDATIFAVEASLESYKRLCEHTANIPKIIPIHAAVADFVGVTRLYLMSGSSLGNSLIQRSEDMQSVSVPACTIASLSEEYNQGAKFDLVKFDIEGAEGKMLANIKPEKFSKAYIGEIHYDLMDLSQDDVRVLFNQFNLEVHAVGNENRVIIHAIL